MCAFFQVIEPMPGVDRPMTVAGLIDKLRALRLDAAVWVAVDDDDYAPDPRLDDDGDVML